MPLGLLTSIAWDGVNPGVLQVFSGHVYLLPEHLPKRESGRNAKYDTIFHFHVPRFIPSPRTA